MSRATDIFRREYGGGNNIMTPTVVECGMVGDALAYELSKGRGFEDEPLYGVSVVRELEDGSTVRERGLSRCFPSERLARQHIATLR